MENDPTNTERFLVNMGQVPQHVLDAMGIRVHDQLHENKETPVMTVEVTKVCDGLGIGDGPISGAAIAESVGLEVMARVDEAIKSPAILVPVDVDANGQMLDDDGCGDGRFTKMIMRGKELLSKSLHRPKVFGGGSAMTMADQIGAGVTAGRSLQEAFSDSIDTLAEEGINYGAHTADHVTDDTCDCGCGAIDKAPVAVSYVPKYRQEIVGQFTALGVSTEGLNDVLDNYTAYATEIEGQDFRGKEVMSSIIDAGKIVKELGGAHIEARIVLNFVPGMTVNQQKIREISDGKVDVFGVDVWRMQLLADKLHPGDEVASTRAFQSMLVYTLAVAAVLTKGDLPVYAVQTIPSPALEPIAA